MIVISVIFMIVFLMICDFSDFHDCEFSDLHDHDFSYFRDRGFSDFHDHDFDPVKMECQPSLLHFVTLRLTKFLGDLILQ